MIEEYFFTSKPFIIHPAQVEGFPDGVAELVKTVSSIAWCHMLNPLVVNLFSNGPPRPRLEDMPQGALRGAVPVPLRELALNAKTLLPTAK